MKQNRQKLDMTHGDPVSLMVRFAVPMMIGSIFQSLYTMVDSAVLGRFVGSDALAAIGATTSTTGLILMVATSVTSAISIIMAQYVGQHNRLKIKETLVSGMYLLFVLGIVLGLVGVFVARPIMQLLHTPENIIDRSVLYIQLICGGGIAQFLYNGSASVLRSLGDSRTPLIFLIVCAFLNVAMDLTAVIVLGLGVAGAAWATILSQLVSAVLCIVVMFRENPELSLARGDLRPNSENMRKIVTMGLQMSLQSLLLSVGMMVITRVINGYGSDIVAAFTVGSGINNLCVMCFSSFAFGFSVYVGQNYGAKDANRIRLGVRKISVLVGCIAALTAVAAEIFARPLVGIYVNAAESAVVNHSVNFVRIQSLFMPVLGWIWIANSTLRGMGKINRTMISSFVELGSKIGISVFLPYAIGVTGIWLAAPLGYVFGILPSLHYYLKGSWQKDFESEEESR